jgi:hypothetical protein
MVSGAERSGSSSRARKLDRRDRWLAFVSRATAWSRTLEAMHEADIFARRAAARRSLMPRRRRPRLRRLHIHAFTRYLGVDYSGDHMYGCRCGEIRPGI